MVDFLSYCYLSAVLPFSNKIKKLTSSETGIAYIQLVRKAGG
jgi:hypothetical protein